MRTRLMTLALIFMLTPAPADPASTSAVIFIPGFLGSFLRDTKTKKRVFVTVTSVLWDAQPVSLEQAELQTPPGPDLEPDGVLDGIPALITTVDVYGSMLQKLKTLTGRTIVPFAYDWRKDPYEAVVQLGHQIDDLKAHGFSQIDIVAHSAGGWLTTYYLAYGTQQPSLAKADWSGAKNIRRAVILGTPYNGSMMLFREMVRGTSLPLMGRLLPPDTYASFPAMYAALPQETGHFLDQNGRPLAIALGDPTAWTEYHFGLMARTELPDSILAARAEFISQRLRAGQQFLALLKLPDVANAPEALKVMSVYGNGTPTLDKCFLVTSGGESRLILDVDHPKNDGLNEDLLFADGDGVVSVSSSVMPMPLRSRAQVMTSRAEHQKLTQAADVQAAILKFLN